MVVVWHAQAWGNGGRSPEGSREASSGEVAFLLLAVGVGGSRALPARDWVVVDPRKGRCEEDIGKRGLAGTMGLGANGAR